MANIWIISADDRRRHDEQFMTLKSVNGFITGDQAREFFLKSNLPPAVLAQIWDLADINKDGKMDRREFSVAMYLIQKKLQGFQLPSTLPDSLKFDPTTPTPIIGLQPSIIPPMVPPAAMLQQPMTRPWIPAPMGQPMMMQPAYYGTISAAPPNVIQPTVTAPTNQNVDWTMHQSSKLKYSQQFNSLDKDKTGFLSGAQARSVFGHSDLPSATLAKIWYLSDLDKDGKLTVEEFSIACHLIDMVKRGASLPPTLPQELAPVNWQRSFRPQRTASFGSDDIPMSPKAAIAFSYESGDVMKSPKMTASSFEEKRRQNLERGQAEIERRRQMLQEQENREREQRERKQREERERQEREHQEQERRRLWEMEKEQARLREEHERREQEYKRMLEQKETARKEAERQRHLDLERQRLEELRNQRQREQEATCHAKQRRANLSFQVQSLTTNAKDLNNRITEMRTKVMDTTVSFEMMKAMRDKKLQEIETGRRLVQDLRTRSMQQENEKMQLQSRKRNQGPNAVQSSIPDAFRQTMTAYNAAQSSLQQQRRSLAEVEDQIKRKQLEIQDREKLSKHSMDRVRKDAADYRELVQKINSLLSQIRPTKSTVTLANGTSMNAVNSNGYKTDVHPTTAANAVPYQVIYDFDAANDGELTLRVGDVVLVFVDHPVEEGWFAGQIGDKVGWFPRDFAMPMGDVQPAEYQPETVQTATAVITRTASNGSTAKQPETGEWYVAAFPFQAMEPGDLGFDVGENIFVIQKSEEWWTGRIGDREGIFPSSYVQELGSTNTAVVEHETVPPAVVEPEKPSVVVSPTPDIVHEVDEAAYEVVHAVAPYAAADEHQLSLQIGDLVKVRSKSPSGWWEGELQKKGEQPKVGWFPGNYVEVLSESGTEARRASTPADQPQPSSNGEATNEEIVEALYDYVKQQDDELSFARGSMIVVLEKLDNDWWRGQLEDGQIGLVPANYVKPKSPPSIRNGGPVAEESLRSSAASTPTSELRKRSMYCQELEQTEQNYADDLQMVVDVFYKQLEVSGLLAPKEVSILFVNWLELLAVARSFVHDLRSSLEDRIGATILKNLDSLKRVFVTFCRHQQSALDFLESKEKAAARFRALHAQCSQHPAARGLQLSYFLLIPLARVTKYHLVVKEILKYTPTDHGDYENLKKAHAAFRQLCDEVNEVATETDNLQMLYWCQNHIKCDSVQPKLVFHSPTNSLGPRRILHSGILHKARSGRLLIGLLFNDFLMLTTPDEKIQHPDSFKLSRNSEIALVLYKTPILLSKVTLQPSTASGSSADASSEENFIILNYGEDTIGLKAVSSNAKILWMKQLDKAIKHAKEIGSNRSKQVSISSLGIGRLLFEVVFVRDLVIPQDCKGASFYIEFNFGRQKHMKSIDLTRTDTLCTTQMILDSKSGLMKIAIFAERLYSPDICVGRTEMELGSMLKMQGSQKNPVVKQLPLSSDFTAQTDTISGHIIVKFVVQLFDDQ